jgi:O-antigen/teichoic acid export membrane protein
MASFFRQPVLVPLSIIFGLNVFISALGSTQSTLLTRQLRFKAQMIVATVSAIVSGSVAIYGAMNGWRIWALAVQNLLGTLLGVCGIWAICPWRPSWKFSFDSLRVLWAFGGYMAAANLLDVSYSRLYTLLVGKLYGTADLGFYNRAINVQNLPAQSIGNLLLRAAFPIFSKAAHDTQLL